VIEPPSVTFSDMDSAPKIGNAGQWLEADGAGETGLVYRLQAQVVDFTLSCRQSDKTLRVKSAHSGGMPKAGETASVQIGGILADATVVDEAGVAGPGAVAVRAALTADMLYALANARSVGVTYRGEFTGTGEDSEGKLRAFAGNCARLTGLTPP
jgi:hypothetical protein